MEEDAAHRYRALLSVEGMHCSSCTAAVETALSSVPGVDGVGVALLQETAEVTYDGRRVTDASAFVAALEAAGFEAAVREARPLAPATQLARLRVAGMTCSSCSAAVESALAATPGVEHAVVSLVLGHARVAFHPDLVTSEALVQAVTDAGFDARLLGSGDAAEATLEVGGMTRATCAAAAEAALRALPGVAEASVDLLAAQAEVRYDPDQVGPRQMIQALSEAGYEARPGGGDGPGRDGGAVRDRERAFWRRKFLLSLIFSVPIFLMSMVLMYIPGPREFLEIRVGGKVMLGELLGLILATPVQFWVGWVFHKGAWRALRRGRANMDVLISVGSTAAYIYSIISIIFGSIHHEYESAVFFETSALLITFISLGKYLEAAAKGKTSQAISKLLNLAPATAILCTFDAEGRCVSEEEVSAALVQRGDVLKVLPGSRVPVDGVVTEGHSFVDESAITGEPVPAEKGEGGEVIGGTINCGGVLRVRCLRTGKDTVLQQIVALVEAAQMSKAPIQALADRISAVFVPIVLALSFATWLGWFLAGVTHAYPRDWVPSGSSGFLFALLFGIAVVVIACPCALGLATPTAVMVGTGVAAANGILIKSAGAMQKAQALHAIVFDKTGTLTAGQPTVVETRLLQPGGPLPLSVAMYLAASAEAGSEHPLARAITRHAALLLGEGVPAAPPPPPFGADSAEVMLSSDSVRLLQAGSVEGLGAAAPRPRQAAFLQANSAGARSVEWLAPASHSEVLPGMGLRCWLRCPAHRLAKGGAASPRPGPAAGTSGGAAATGVAREPPRSPLAPVNAGPGRSLAQVDIRVAVGNRQLMAGEGVAVPAAVLDFMRTREDEGMTCILLAADGALLAVIAITDPLKPEAPAVISALRRMGLHCHMVTGDNWRTARAVAAKLGILNVMAEVLPAGKAEKIRQLQAGGRHAVAMVGDGVNDSPALAQADVGMAIGSGTDIAVEAADFVLMKSDLESVLIAIDLAVRTFNRIRLNYVWAMGYNICMIPVAAGALYPPLHFQMPPWIAGACMALSSVCVVVSSLLLHRYRPPRPASGGGAQDSASSGVARS